MSYAFFVELSCCTSNSFNLHFVDFWICDSKTTSAVSEHWVVFVESSNLSSENSWLHIKFLRKSVELCLIFCLDELVKRWVKETDSYWVTLHSLDDFVEVFLLEWEDLCKVSLAVFCVFRNDHLLECSKFWFVEEHVFCTAKTNTLCTEAECIFSILWCITVSEYIESLNCLTRSSLTC